MAEILECYEIETNYDSLLKDTLVENHFILFRVNPQFQNEAAFPPKLHGKIPSMAHLFMPPTGSVIADIPELQKDRVLRGPKDIREVISVGSMIEIDKVFDYAVYAPEITGAPGKLIHIFRFDEWDGFGLTVKTFDHDDDRLWEMTLIGFSDR